MRTERFEFAGAQGAALAARLELPDEPALASAVFAHCFTCGKDSSAATRIARAFAARRIATLRFDFTGLGDSGGDFGNSGFSSNIDDLLAAAQALAARSMAPALLIGHSLGGAAVLAAAAHLPSVKAVVTLGAPADPAHALHLFGDATERIERDGAALVALAGRPFRIGRAMIEDLRRQPPVARIAELGRALLIMHAPGDDTVPIEHAARLFRAARHPKSFVSLDDADHLLSRARDAQYAADVIAAWSSRYLPG